MIASSIADNSFIYLFCVHRLSHQDAIVSADEHCAQQLDAYGLDDDGDRDFVSEIFHGIIRYKKLLKVR